MDMFRGFAQKKHPPGIGGINNPLNRSIYYKTLITSNRQAIINAPFYDYHASINGAQAFLAFCGF
jgi:hypothetical protein